MFQENAMVIARKAIEKMYDGLCTVSENQEYQKPNKSTGYHEVVTLTDQRCRLSFNSSPASDTDAASAIVQNIKLFIAPDVSIKAGSKITVTQNGVTTAYKNSGVPALYATHQEITLKLFEGWA